VDQLGMIELEALAPTIRQWRGAGQPLPLLFSQAQLAASADAFALEFSDMQHARRVLFGADPITPLRIDLRHLRIHLERELKGKSLALRDRYALAAGDRSLILELLTESLSTFLSLFRAALRLYQPEKVSHKLDALRALAEHIRFEPQPFLVINELKSNPARDQDLDPRELFNRYWHAIETVTSAVDQRIHLEP
jgi:hypothetical protein